MRDFMFGAIRQKSIKTQELYLRTLNYRIGRGLLWQRLTTGIAFPHQPDLNYDNPPCTEENLENY